MVVVTHGTAELTTRALRTLVDTATDVDLRVFVHDNASPDDTVSRLTKEVPEAEVHAATDNAGFAAGVNQALRRGDAPWVLVLNSDAWPAPGAVATMVRTAEARLAAGTALAVVAPRLERPDGTLEHSTFPFPSLRVAALTATGTGQLFTGLARRHLLVGAWNHDQACAVDWAVGAAWLVPRAVFDHIGGLDERFFLYAEDLEWCWRAADHGHTVWFDPSAVIVHVGGASARRSFDDRRRTRTHLANTYAVLAGRWPTWRIAIYRAIQVVGCARLWALARSRGRRAEATHWRHHVVAHVRGARR